ncbi:MAG: formate C-acetyltransferase [bacterium]
MKNDNKFTEGNWCMEIDVADFVSKNFTEYTGDESFLSDKTAKSSALLNIVEKLLIKEQKKGVLDIEVKAVSGVNAFEPGYIDKKNEIIFGLQTDAPLKRIINPFGGYRMVESQLSAYGYEIDPQIAKYFKLYRKTHNEGVFDAYDDEIRAARKAGILTGLPDAYGRGRIIGDYRRVALYGIEYLKKEKQDELKEYTFDEMDADKIRFREEISMQIRAFDDILNMAKSYGFDISVPAKTAKEAVQWLYFGYLASVKENNGAAMSIGRIDAFLDIYIENDLKNNVITETEAQELIDQLVIKLRLVRHLRTPEYDELFSGDPTWVTASIAGMIGKTSGVTKTSYRLLHTLINLNPSPEPNMTILWSEKLPESFKKYCAFISIKTDSIQYENDDLMRPIYGDDYAIACCVSAMRHGKDMQFFGARCNLAKGLLYAINGGVDEVSGATVIKGFEPITDDVLDYETVKNRYFDVLEKICTIYAKSMNIIHYMHDKYAYESAQMALLDANVHRYMAYGVAGLSVVTDSLSAIKHAKVKPIRNENGIAIDFEIEGDFPKYGNDDDTVDNIALEVLEKAFTELKKHKTYKNAEPTLSVLTITSNVVYGKKTGSTPDGRKAGVPFAPGANPMHNRDESGAICSLNSVSKIDYENCCKDGVSNTFSITPTALGADIEEQKQNLKVLLDGYFSKKAHHLNVNVLNKEMLIDAMNNPSKYPLLTIRVSGYAVKFNRLTKSQQEEVISRTFHEKF